jgi:hypothetical protein
MNFEGARKYILEKLARELDPRLTYHSIGHTLDVCESAIRIARLEGITEPNIVLLKTAALYHDSGMLVTYKGHEEASVKIVHDTLPSFNYSAEDIMAIEGMILNTRLPQEAWEKLGMILCDADLDYLGRDDYFLISHQLKYEWDVLGFYPTTLMQWYELQIKFVGNHKYFTQSAVSTREKTKQGNLQQVRDVMSQKIVA